ncbi:hypothetical protein DOH76_12220 [Salmonella enterica subsp. enterica serovar Oranienburg]|nr:hypothetical protein [Salmonella enterica]EBG5026312.1 hypothetical protein [Salmonella enterica subsp. enterica serovar Oranienburg]EAS1262624.1 hypothetical protein [Salmonella enterica]EBB1604426.1 hypothetical protein [Salmonella enterica]EBB9533829.1 hypothetical protein [Salmonella enterica]
MKLSPEAKQAIKTAIEQLRLLLVDEDDVESLERLKKTFLHGAKTIIDELDEKQPGKVVIEAPRLKFVTPVIKSASISNGGQAARLIEAANFHSFKRICAEIDKLTEEVKALRSSNRKLKKRVNTLEK